MLPNALGALVAARGGDVSAMLHEATGMGGAGDDNLASVQRLLPPVRSVVAIVVDGLGHANLKAASGHARTLSSMQSKRIETVIPSTTGAALTSITTGRLPGEHGLVGYKIRHPQLGLRSTLKGWDGIEDPRRWQRAQPLFELATRSEIQAAAIGRPAHARGGLTEAILRGAEYFGGQTIDDRFSIASRLLRTRESQVIYLYIDELDKIAHAQGWQSVAWTKRLEHLDGAVQSFLTSLPGDVGVVVVADHGVIDVPHEQRFVLDDGSVDLSRYSAIGGEPRMRSLYLANPDDAAEAALEMQRALGKSAWVGARSEAIEANWFGPIDDEVAHRLGDVIVAARGMNAFILSADGPDAMAMVGQHGGLSDEERGVPLLLGGAFANSSFASAVQSLAAARAQQVLS